MHLSWDLLWLESWPSAAGAAHHIFHPVFLAFFDPPSIYRRGIFEVNSMSSWRRCRRSSPWPVGCWIFSLDYGVWKKWLFLVVLNSYSFMIMKGEGRFCFFCSKFFETSLVGPSPLFVGLRSQSHSETRTRRSRSAAWSRQRPQGVLKVICAIFTCMIRLGLVVLAHLLMSLAQATLVQKRPATCKLAQV